MNFAKLKNSIAMAVLVGAGPILTATSASAENGFEIGGFAGVHLFNTNNELGVADAPNANSLRNTFIGGIRLGYHFLDQVALEGELGILPTEARQGRADVFGFAYRIHPMYYFTPQSDQWRPFVLAGVGGMYGSSNEDTIIGDDADFVIHAGAGVKYRVESNWGVRLDGRYLLPPTSDGEGLAYGGDWEVTLGLYKTFRDAGEAPAKAPSDDDGDGIVGDDDKCPNEAEDKDGYQDEDGCPEADNDGDGIADADDKCPNKAETKNGIDDEDGCPEEDVDGDGLIGSADACPDKAEDKDGFEDEDGCPEIDNDKDGVADADDKCPTELETINGYEDNDGCPDEVPKELKRFSGTIKGIYFATGKSVIRKSSYRTLNKAAATLKKYPDIRIEVQGHTDDRGDDAKNQELSQARANAVREYLVAQGIAEDRLTAVGYGETQPIADNKRSSGRSKNRRVEFKFLTNVSVVNEEAPEPEAAPVEDTPSAE